MTDILRQLSAGWDSWPRMERNPQSSKKDMDEKEYPFLELFLSLLLSQPNHF